MPLSRRDQAPLLRQGVVGIVCFVLNLALMWSLVEILGLHVLLATAFCFFSLNAIGHHLSRTVVFRHSVSTYGHSLTRFNLVMAVSFALNLSAMALTTQWLEIPYLLASALIAALFFIGNFVAHRNWTFR